MLEQSILESAGYRVDLAVSGEEGLERARAGDHALILVDVEMPGMDGFTFIEHIRRDPRLQHTPAILVTSRNAPEHKRRGVEVGAQDYVVKSEFDQAVLLPDGDGIDLLAEIRSTPRARRPARAAALGRGRRRRPHPRPHQRRQRICRQALRHPLCRRPGEPALGPVQSLGGPRKILVVDDSPTYLAELAELLREDGYEVSLAHSGEEALDLLAVQPVDCIIMDVQMPGIGGLEACVRIKAAPIAHEINNPLAVVTGNLDLVAARFAETASATDATGAIAAARQPLHDALEAAERVRRIVRDLKIFARSDEEERIAAVDPHKVIESALRMTANEVRHHARLSTAFGDVPHVLANESRLGQVLLNLIVNAAQAILVGHADGNDVRVSTMTDGPDRVAIEVADIGSGLGLAICQRIVGELGGAITLRSTVGEGGVFRVVLRRADATATPDGTSASLPVAPAAAPAPRGRLLVVDDEAALCTTIERILGRDHDVTTTTSPHRALELIAAGERFDVILSDPMMPEMTGMDLYGRLAILAPAQAGRMIFMSGGTLTADSTRFLHAAGRVAIDKPFRAAALRDLVAGAMHAATSPDGSAQ